MPKGLTTGIIFIPLDVRWPRNRKVRPLIVRHGVDGLAAWSLYLAMACYCRENLSDGWVPAEEIGALAYPLPVEQAEQLIKLLADYRLISEPHSEPHSDPQSEPHSEPHSQGYLVRAYVKRNGTRVDALAHAAKLAEAGRLASHSRWSSRAASDPHTRPHSGSDAQTKTESETNDPRARRRAPARAGREWTPHDALDAPEPKRGGRPTPPPVSQVIAQKYSPSDDPEARAAEARQALAERQRVAGVRVALDEGAALDDAARLHDEALARAQLAEARAARIPDVPAAEPEPGDDDWQPPF